MKGLVKAVFALAAVTAFAANQKGAAPERRTGKQIFEGGCIACHGPGGKGAPRSAIGFEPPSTFPDFTNCLLTTPELEADWRAIILEGGPVRGFSRIMPSFRDELTDAQIDAVIRYLRSLCPDPAWPRGELKLPLALVTEKAFPENETVVASAINARGAPGVSNEVIYERRIGARNQLEINVPIEFQHPGRNWYGGFGDATLGLKRVFLANLRSGSIFSLQGEVTLPTGSRRKDLGSGVTTLGTFAAFGQLLPCDSFFQFQGGADLPTDTEVAPTAVYWRTVLGKTYVQRRGLGRAWSPMIEFVAERDLETGAKTNWDVVPQMQVTLSSRQHIRANAGLRIPFTNTAERSIQVMVYVLWDWQDGGLRGGW